MRSWKRMWKDELKALPPLSDRVAGSPRPETESEVRVMPDGTLTRKKKALAFALPPAVVAVVLAAVLLCVFLLPASKAAERFVLMLEINPAVAVVTDADGTVTDVAVEDVGSLLSNGVNEGANEIYSVSYFSSQYDTAYGDALAKAVDAAKAKGTVLAEASGKALGEVLNVEEYQDDQYGRYVSSSINMSRASGAVAEATMADMGVMPGEMDVEAVIRVEFALTDSQ